MTRISFLDPFGSSFEADLVPVPGDEPPAGPPLTAVQARLSLPGEERTVRMVRSGSHGHDGRTDSYERLDNEILAGVRISRLYAGGSHPAEVSRLLGYSTEAAEPFALLEPLRGEPVGAQAGQMLGSDRVPFQKSLLRAVLTLNGAGIAHRGISPDTVRWDGAGRSVQLTDFSCATLIGAPRTVIGTMPWQPPEQRHEHARGRVSEQDDMWAVGKLVYYVITGNELTDVAQLRDHPSLSLFAAVITSPDRRPTARELLRHLGSSPSVRLLSTDGGFARGRNLFFEQRIRKHPQLEEPPEPPAVHAGEEAPDPVESVQKDTFSLRRVPFLVLGAVILLALALVLLLIVQG